MVSDCAPVPTVKLVVLVALVPGAETALAALAAAFPALVAAFVSLVAALVSLVNALPALVDAALAAAVALASLDTTLASSALASVTKPAKAELKANALLLNADVVSLGCGASGSAVMVIM